MIIWTEYETTLRKIYPEVTQRAYLLSKCFDFQTNIKRMIQRECLEYLAVIVFTVVISSGFSALQ